MGYKNVRRGGISLEFDFDAADSPEESLLKAVVSDALFCIRKGKKSHSIDTLEEAIADYRWIFYDWPRRSPLPFSLICEFLNKDPDLVRKNIIQNADYPSIEDMMSRCVRLLTIENGTKRIRRVTYP